MYFSGIFSFFFPSQAVVISSLPVSTAPSDSHCRSGSENEHFVLFPSYPTFSQESRDKAGRKAGWASFPQSLLSKYLMSFPLSGRGSTWDQIFAKLGSKNCTCHYFSKQSGRCLLLTILQKSCLDKDQYPWDEQATAVHYLCLEPPIATSDRLCLLMISAPKHLLKRENKEQNKGCRQGCRGGNGALVPPGCDGGKGRDGGIAPGRGAEEAQSSPGGPGTHPPLHGGSSAPMSEPQL